MSLYTESGYPKKSIIKKMLKDFGVDMEKIVFNAEFGKKGAGILWKAESIDEMMKEWITYAQDQGIVVLVSYFNRRIHSIWFEKKL